MNARVYRMNVFWTSLFALFATGGAGLIAYLAYRMGGPAGWATLLLALFPLSLLLFPLSSRVILDDEWITVSGMGAQRWPRASIVARRIKRYQHMSALLLLTESPGAAPLQIALIYRFDAEFERWLASLRDLDAEEKQVVADEVAAVFTPAKIARGRQLCRALNGAAAVCAVWLLFVPVQFRWAVWANLALTPLALLLIARGRGLYALDSRPQDPRPSPAFAVLIPGMVLLAKVVLQISLAQPTQLIAPTAALSAVLAVVIARADPRAKLLSKAALSVLLIAYAASTVTWTNCAFDHSPAQPFTAQVQAKWITGGQHPMPELRLTPWGPVTTPTPITVSAAKFERTQPGETVRIALRRGFLNIPWFYLID